MYLMVSKLVLFQVKHFVSSLNEEILLMLFIFKLISFICKILK